MSSNSDDKTMFAMRISKNEKDQLRKLYADMGLDLSTAVNLFFKQSGRKILYAPTYREWGGNSTFPIC